MAKTWSDLRDILATKVSNVYFQPPESSKMQYPCIRFKLSNIVNTFADNIAYNQATAYELTYISKAPDEDMRYELARLPMCSFDRHYTADNLNHYVYTIFF